MRPSHINDPEVIVPIDPNASPDSGNEAEPMCMMSPITSEEEDAPQYTSNADIISRLQPLLETSGESGINYDESMKVI